MKKPNSRKLCCRFLLFVTAVLLVACNNNQETTLRLGSNVWLGYEPLYLARELQYWDAQQVQLVEFLSSSETIRAFRNHEIDAVALTLDEILLLLQDGIALQVVLITDISLGGDVILARPEISSIKDLAGLRVAVESTALGAYILTRALQLHGLTPADVEIVHLDANEHVTTFAADIADAVVGCEPERSALLKQGARQIFDSSEIPGEIIDVVAVRSDYLQQHSDNIHVLLQGWFKAVGYLREHPEKGATIMARRMQMTAEDVLLSLQGIQIPDRAENLRLLAGETPQILAAAKMLNNIMLSNHLINATVDVSNLPMPDPLNQLTQ